MTASSVTDEHQAVLVPRATLEALERDAARYRWLRQWVPDQNGLEDHMAELGISQPMTPDGLDAALDAAIDADRMATGFNAALDQTRDAVGRDGRGEPDGDPR